MDVRNRQKRESGCGISLPGNREKRERNVMRWTAEELEAMRLADAEIDADFARGYDKERVKTNNRRYYERHKAKINAHSKAYYWAHREEGIEYRRAYNAAHKAENAARCARYYAEHKEEIAEYRRRWYQEHREEILARSKKARDEAKKGKTE